MNRACYSKVLASILPPGVATAELRGYADISELLPEEAVYLSAFSGRRQRDFAGGRQCARAALMQLGIHDFPLRIANDRIPIWPITVIGSISHTEGYCGAAVSRTKDFISLGIDTERADAVTADLWAYICTEFELERIRSLPPALRVMAATLLFSCKETFFKSQFPLNKIWLEFSDLEVESSDWQRSFGEFWVRHREDDHGAARHRGLFCFHEGFISTGVAISREDFGSRLIPSVALGL